MLSGWRPQGHLGISPSTGSEPGYIRGATRSGPEMRLNVPLITVSEKASASGPRWDWHRVWGRVVSAAGATSQYNLEVWAAEAARMNRKEGFTSDGVARWLSAQGFGGGQSSVQILALRCSGSCRGCSGTQLPRHGTDETRLCVRCPSTQSPMCGKCPRHGGLWWKFPYQLPGICVSEGSSWTLPSSHRH